MKIKLTDAANTKTGGYAFYLAGDTQPTDVTGLELKAFKVGCITYVHADELRAAGFTNFPSGHDYIFKPSEFEVIEE